MNRNDQTPQARQVRKLRAMRFTTIAGEDAYQAALLQVEHTANVFANMTGDDPPALRKATELAYTQAEAALAAVVDAYVAAEVMRALAVRLRIPRSQIGFPDKHTSIPGAGLLLEWKDVPLQ